MPLLTTVVVGALQTNCYVLKAPDSDRCAIIDPGGEPQKIIEAIRAAELDLEYILCTHGHPDHTGGAALVHEELGGSFYLAASDLDYSAQPAEWLVAALGGFTSPPEPDAALETTDVLSLGSSEIRFIRTPGHTPGSTCFLFEGMVFTGDTLFRGSIGRYDLPGGDGRQELDSIRNHLLVLPEDTPVYPGHGPSSTIGEEKRSNPFVR